MNEQAEDPAYLRPSAADGEVNLPGVVGIGASAGGITALQDFFADVPEQTGLTFVVVMHLSPEHQSHLAEVLQPFIRMPVLQVQGRTRLEPDHVYVIPPGRSLAISYEHLELGEFEEPRGRRVPIDMFFRTIADMTPDGIGVLLSGSGSDGVLGLQAIKEKGGVIMAQSPDEAEYDTMPRAAIATGLLDFVLPARELGARVVELRMSGLRWPTPPDADGLEESEAADVRRILSRLEVRSGHDFTGYKTTTVLRRIGRRMRVTRTSSPAGYLDYLDSHSTEWQALVKDLLISVTNFFRDSEAFDQLEQQVIPELFRDRTSMDVVRVWVAGCATGEEAYSVAMLLAEHARRMERPPRIQVFGSDLDSDAIAHARLGVYPQAIAADLTDQRLHRFFIREGEFYRVTRELRELVLFSQHNLLRDPPFTRIDLISCRNLLIYFERDLQQRALQLFRHALHEDGFLFLGNSEGIENGTGGLRPLDKRHRIYQRVPSSESRYVTPAELPLSLRRRGHAELATLASTGRFRTPAELHLGALELHAPPSILVDRDYSVVHVSETANRYLQFPAGVPTVSLLKAARPELRLPLRSALLTAFERHANVRTGWVAVDLDGTSRQVQLHVTAGDPAQRPQHALVLFLEADVPGPAGEANEATVSRYGADADIEIAGLHDDLQGIIEDAATRQEELKASNEELQSINEEYKSTLEELETSKEELQSVNEELKTVNDELKAKVEELARANDDLSNLMVATQIPTIFLDDELRIRRFTPAARGIFNLLDVDEGRPISHVTSNLEYPGFGEDCTRVLSTRADVERQVSSSAGRDFLARITPYRANDERIGGVVATFTDVTRMRRAADELRHSEERFRSLVAATAQIVWTADSAGLIDIGSLSWRDFTGQALEQQRGRGWLEAVHADDREAASEQWSAAVASGEPLDTSFRVWHDPAGEWRYMEVRATPVHDAQGRIREWVGMYTDISVRRHAEDALVEAKLSAERSSEAKSQFLSTLSHELRTPLTAIIGITDLLAMEATGPLTERQRDHLKRVQLSAWHLVSIINEILTYSRSEAGKLPVSIERVDVLEIGREIVSMLSTQAEAKGIALRLNGPVEPLVATTDAGKIRQIALNLVGNAIKFTPSGEVVLELNAGDPYLELVVRDTGPGIPPERHEDIFEPFVQVDSSSTRTEGGTGLGLAVCRRLARALGGDVVVDSAPGHGSVFTARIPLDASLSGSELVRTP